jgi:hypothetical protein
MYGMARDVNGAPIEGVRVDVTFPTADGSATLPFWTDETGQGSVLIEVAEPPLMTRVTVSASARTDRTSVSDRDWYYRTERLADESAGFWTEVSDRSVVAGQEVVVTTHALTTEGAPMGGLLIDWTWMFDETGHVTTGYTNADGVARTSFVVEDDTTDAQVYVYAHTSAFSMNRRSKTWFQRADAVLGPR